MRVCVLVCFHVWALVKSCFIKDLALLYVPKRCHHGAQQAELAHMPTKSPNLTGPGERRNPLLRGQRFNPVLKSVRGGVAGEENFCFSLDPLLCCHSKHVFHLSR